MSKYSFSLWLLTILVCVTFHAMCVGKGFISAVRIGLSVSYIFAILMYLRRPGKKAEGVVSCACAAALNVFELLPNHLLRRELSILEEYIVVAVIVALFAGWLIFAILALRLRQAPNFTIGKLSLASIISPGSLECLDFIQFLTLTMFGLEWWHFRPFDALYQLLWYS